jgi:hypothetical protein
MKRRFVTPLRLGLVGIALVTGYMAWSAVSDYRAARAFPWLKPHVYPGEVAIHMGQLGFFLCLAAIIWAVVAWTKRKLSG